MFAVGQWTNSSFLWVLCHLYWVIWHLQGLFGCYPFSYIELSPIFWYWIISHFLVLSFLSFFCIELCSIFLFWVISNFLVQNVLRCLPILVLSYLPFFWYWVVFHFLVYWSDQQQTNHCVWFCLLTPVKRNIQVQYFFTDKTCSISAIDNINMIYD
jgi:hypothetical protein